MLVRKPNAFKQLEWAKKKLLNRLFHSETQQWTHVTVILDYKNAAQQYSLLN